MPAKRKAQQKTLSALYLSSESEESTAEESIVVRKAANKKKAAANTSAAQMPPKRGGAKQPAATPATRKAPARGGKKGPEAESELSSLDISEIDDIEEIEEEDPEPPKLRNNRRSGSKQPTAATTKTAAKKITPATATSRKNPRSVPNLRAKKPQDPIATDEDATETEEEASQKSTSELEEEDDDLKVTETLANKSKAPATTTTRRAPPRRKLTKKQREAQALAEKEIAETQYTSMEVDESDSQETEEEAEEKDEDEIEDEVSSAQPPPKPTSRKRSASESGQPAAKKAVLSASSTPTRNAAGEDALRLQLEEMARKLEETDRRLKELSKLKHTEAEAALIAYKEVMDARIVASEKLHAALQEDLDAHKHVLSENKTLKKDLQTKTTEIASLTTKISSQSESIFKAETEITSLNAKLTAARQAISAPPPNQPQSQPALPGSAVKPKPHLNGHPHSHSHSTSSQSQLPWEITAKEDLYGDLTALTVLGVKIFPDQPNQRVYDCIQTGKNGTLHFKLTTPVVMVDDEDEITFTPHLDPHRDARILSLLPEYLTEEITFARGNATRFYLKLLGVVLRNEGVQGAGRQPTAETE